jgi:hypothetical protein
MNYLIKLLLLGKLEAYLLWGDHPLTQKQIDTLDNFGVLSTLVYFLFLVYAIFTNLARLQQGDGFAQSVHYKLNILQASLACTAVICITRAVWRCIRWIHITFCRCCLCCWCCFDGIKEDLERQSKPAYKKVESQSSS